MPLASGPAPWRRAAIKGAILLAFSLAAGAADEGWFGLALKVDAGGWLDPVIQSITVDHVIAGSPAAAAHLAAGDSVVGVDGLPVAQAHAAALKAKMRKAPGEVLHLRLKHADGTPYAADLVAAPPP